MIGPKKQVLIRVHFLWNIQAIQEFKLWQKDIDGARLSHSYPKLIPVPPTK